MKYDWTTIKSALNGQGWTYTINRDSEGVTGMDVYDNSDTLITTIPVSGHSSNDTGEPGVGHKQVKKVMAYEAYQHFTNGQQAQALLIVTYMAAELISEN